MLNDKLKSIIYWVGLGASLVVYAHANFASKEDYDKLEKRVDGLATKEDVREVKVSVDRVYDYLLNKKE